MEALSDLISVRMIPMKHLSDLICVRMIPMATGLLLLPPIHGHRTGRVQVVRREEARNVLHRAARDVRVRPVVRQRVAAADVLGHA